MQQRLIRFEKLQDVEAVREINVAAFGREDEADVVDQLRGIESTFSFVAVEWGQIVGHIFFSPVEIEGECTKDIFMLGLAPVAVLPAYQRQGIGSLMIRYSLKELVRPAFGNKNQLGCQAVVVLGDPKYYSRFGFTTAKEKELGCEYLVPDEAFMVLELKDRALAGCKGKVKYRPEFSKFE